MVTERIQYSMPDCFSATLAKYRKSTNSQPVTGLFSMFFQFLKWMIFSILQGILSPPCLYPKGYQWSLYQRCLDILESVQEHLEEGVSMHHCVFDNAYYLKENSLILSATIEGRRIETIEVNLDTLKVVQSRGVCNKNTEYHEQIVNLVNANRGLISRRMKATA